MNCNTPTVLKVAALLAVGFTTSAFSLTEFDQDVTPDVIFGTGNTNGGFTTDRQGGIELGLRAKIPFTDALNSNGDGTYSYTLAETDHDSNPATPNQWSFDFTVNTDYDGTTGFAIDDFTYALGMDADPSLGTDFLVFDPITPSVIAPFFDHSIGDNTTANGGGTEAGDAGTYAALISDNNVLQQSWRYAFFPIPPLDGYDPSISGTYAVYLLARDASGAVVARTEIQVLIGDVDPAGLSVACVGFQPPLDQDVVINKPNRILSLRMNLLADDGLPLSGDDIIANPVFQLTFNGGTYTGEADLESVDSAGRGDDGNMFVFGDEYWSFNLKSKDLVPGSYTITVVSGDPAEYTIDPSCEVDFTIQ